VSGYGTVEFSPDDGVHHGPVAGTRDVVSHEGESIPQLKQAFRQAVDDYLELCGKWRHQPERPAEE
jgi:predicted HicB family RNase H-like nuclease